MTEWLVCSILLVASISDVKKRRVHNLISLALLIVVCLGLIPYFYNWQPADLLNRFTASILTFLSFLLPALHQGGVGGADIKTASILALHAGLKKSILMIPLSFFLILVYYCTIKRNSSGTRSAPYMPFLTASYIVASLAL